LLRRLAVGGAHHVKKYSMTVSAVNALNNMPDRMPKTNAGQMFGLGLFEQTLQ